MEGSSSNNDSGGDAKSGCNCSGAAVDNNNDANAKAARRAAAIVAAKRAQNAAKTAALIAAAKAAQEIRHRQYLQIKEEEKKKQLADDHQTAGGSASAATSGSAAVVNGGPAAAAVSGNSVSTGGSPSTASGGSSADIVMDEASEITITVSPTTGGQFDLSVLKTDSVESLKKVISKRLRVPKERICLLYRERWASHLLSFVVRLTVVLSPYATAVPPLARFVCTRYRRRVMSRATPGRPGLCVVVDGLSDKGVPRRPRRSDVLFYYVGTERGLGRKMGNTGACYIPLKG